MTPIIPKESPADPDDAEPFLSQNGFSIGSNIGGQMSQYLDYQCGGLYSEWPNYARYTERAELLFSY